jgi:exonuclease III
LKLLTINVQGIKGKNKQAELKLLCQFENPDIIFGTESHLDSSYLDNEVFPEGYTVIRNDRDRYGGGVFIAFKECLQIIEMPEVTESSKIESLFAKLETTNSLPVYLAVFYRPPDSREDTLIELGKQINILTNKKHLPNIIIGGDFNVPSIDWNENVIMKKPQYGLKINEVFLNVVEENIIHQIVTQLLV